MLILFTSQCVKQSQVLRTAKPLLVCGGTISHTACFICFSCSSVYLQDRFRSLYLLNVEFIVLVEIQDHKKWQNQLMWLKIGLRSQDQFSWSRSMWGWYAVAPFYLVAVFWLWGLNSKQFWKVIEPQTPNCWTDSPGRCRQTVPHCHGSSSAWRFYFMSVLIQTATSDAHGLCVLTAPAPVGGRITF